jgi:hypothetical protein
VRKTFVNSLFDRKLPRRAGNAWSIDLWLVLEQDRVAKTGYHIVYDSNRIALGW